MNPLDYRQPYETDAECLDRYRRCMPTCSDCGAEIVNDIDAVFGICGDCMDTARRLAVIGVLSFTAYIATASVNARARIEARERDDFEDLDDISHDAGCTCLTCDPLPPSSWWEMSEADRDRATKRQQTGMAGGDA